MPEIDTSFDWGGSYSCEYRLMEVDPDTWEGLARVDGVLSMSVSRDRGGDLIDEGSAEIAMDVYDVPREFWGRLEVLARNDGGHTRQAIATLYFIPGPIRISKGRKIVSYSCMSVLFPPSERSILVGSNFQKGMDGAAYAVSLLSECTPAPITSDGTFSLSENVVYSEGTSYLEAVWMLLDAAGWCIRISERGEVTIQPKPTEPVLIIDSANARLVGPEIEADDGLEDVKNRYIAVANDSIVTSVDESARRTSYETRGFYSDEYDGSPQLLDGETLQEYSDRKLAELTEVLGTKTYRRAFWPGVVPFDIVEGSISSVMLDCTMRVLSQSIEIGAGIAITETSEVIA